jgi:predicted adenylyl cyclase CyaB
MELEVEVQSFVSPEDYHRLKRFLDKHAQLKEELDQETHYLDAPVDLRIQKDNTAARLWLKSGRVHDEIREEVEVACSPDDFDKLATITAELGFQAEIKWFRHRLLYDWNGIKVCLDHTRGYGHIIELELMSKASEKESNLSLLNKKLKELRVTKTPREEFRKKFANYKNNWKKLLEA